LFTTVAMAALGTGHVPAARAQSLLVGSGGSGGGAGGNGIASAGAAAGSAAGFPTGVTRTTGAPATGKNTLTRVIEGTDSGSPDLRIRRAIDGKADGLGTGERSSRSPSQSARAIALDDVRAVDRELLDFVATHRVTPTASRYSRSSGPRRSGCSTLRRRWRANGSPPTRRDGHKSRKRKRASTRNFKPALPLPTGCISGQRYTSSIQPYRASNW